MLNKFPNFTAVTLSDHAEIEARTINFEPYSDFNFHMMWACGAPDTLQACLLNGNLAVITTEYLSCQPLCTFLGANDPDSTALQLLDYLKANGHPQPMLRLVPEVSVAGLDSAKFSIGEDPNNWDYVYSLEKLATFPGGKYEDKRRKARHFHRDHPDAHAKLIDLRLPESWQHIADLNGVWSEVKAKSDGFLHLPKESAAMDRFLDAGFQDVVCVGIFTDQGLVGYSIFTPLHDGYAICHFSKGILHNPGVYEFLMQESAKILLASGCRMLNYQEDLGLPGLRFFKRSFVPERFLKKYTVQAAL